MPKKKTAKSRTTELPSLDEDIEIPTKPVPTFVTEVVENEDGNGEIESESEAVEPGKESDKLEKVLKDIEGKEEKSEALKEATVEKDAKPAEQSRADQDSDKPEKESTETDKLEESESQVNQKQVVEELFTRKDSGLTEISVGRKKRHSVILWGMIVIVAAVTTSLGLLFFSGTDTSKITILAQPTPTLAPTPTTVPSPTPEIQKTDISVQVLNGGGVPGAASKMKSFLVEKGYSVLDVGNTDDYSYEETVVFVKKTKADILPVIESDLTDEYTLGTSSADLDEDSEYDLQVIVGKK